MADQVNIPVYQPDFAMIDEVAEKVGGKNASWISAIAKAMGKALGLKAANLVFLSDAIGKNAVETAKAAQTLADNPDDKQAAADKEKAAAIGSALNTQFQAASQEYSLMANAFSTGIRALGEAQTTLARKNG